ncbi:hypothetical protein KEM56_002620, partial [Ascosphaera pollenicola]
EEHGEWEEPETQVAEGSERGDEREEVEDVVEEEVVGDIRRKETEEVDGPENQEEATEEERAEQGDERETTGRVIPLRGTSGEPSPQTSGPSEEGASEDSDEKQMASEDDDREEVRRTPAKEGDDCQCQAAPELLERMMNSTEKKHCGPTFLDLVKTPEGLSLNDICDNHVKIFCTRMGMDLTSPDCNPRRRIKQLLEYTTAWPFRVTQHPRWFTKEYMVELLKYISETAQTVMRGRPIEFERAQFEPAKGSRHLDNAWYQQILAKAGRSVISDGDSSGSEWRLKGIMDW